MDLFLITGFLGAGKTTFLKNFVNQFKHKKIFLIINEFGKTGVDGTLLANIGAVLQEINNGSIFCACRLDKFEETLHNAIGENPDVILVEASGLSDPVSVERVVTRDEFSSIQYCGSVCIADAARLESVIDTAIVCKNQIAVSSLAIINKIDLVDESKIAQCESILKDINPFITIEKTSFGTFESDWFSFIEPMSKRTNIGIDTDTLATKIDITLQKSQIVFLPASSSTLSLETLEKMVQSVSNDTYRMKGFVRCIEGMMLVDSVSAQIVIKPWNEVVSEDDENKLVCLAGRGMPLRKTLQETKKWYSEYIQAVE